MEHISDIKKPSLLKAQNGILLDLHNVSSYLTHPISKRCSPLLFAVSKHETFQTVNSFLASFTTLDDYHHIDPPVSFDKLNNTDSFKFALLVIQFTQVITQHIMIEPPTSHRGLTIF